MAFPTDRRPYLFKDGSQVIPDGTDAWFYVTPAGRPRGPYKTLQMALEGRLWSQAGAANRRPKGKTTPIESVEVL